MQSSLSAVSSHGQFNAFRHVPSTKKSAIAAQSQAASGFSSLLPRQPERLMKLPRLRATPQDAQILQTALEHFQPSELEKRQFQPEVLKKYPVIGAVHKNLKQNSQAMRELLTQWLNGQPVDSKVLDRLEKRLSVMPAAKGWERLSQKLELLRPVAGWEDVLHNVRALVGVPGAMVWTASQTVKYFSTPEAEWNANPENSLKGQVLAHNRYLQFPDVHEANVAYWALQDWRTELQQRLQLLKTLVSDQAVSHNAENDKKSAEA